MSKHEVNKVNNAEGKFIVHQICLKTVNIKLFAAYFAISSSSIFTCIFWLVGLHILASSTDSTTKATGVRVLSYLSGKRGNCAILLTKPY